jgi:hypothetical protein
MTEPPRNDVLAERIGGLADRIGGLERRMSELATEKTLIALIEGRDRTVNAQMKAMQDDIADLTAALATERAERMAADKQEKTDRETGDKTAEDRARFAKTLAISAISLMVAVVLGIATLISQIGGPTG